MECTASDGKWVISESGLQGKTIRIALIDKDYTIVKVSDKNGVEKKSSNASVSWDCTYEDEDNTFTIETRRRTSTMTVNVDGDPSMFRLRYKDDATVDLNAGTNSVTFDSELDAPFSLEHVSYNKTLYKAEIANGGSVERDGKSFVVNPTDGSQLDITVDFPDMDVPVSFTFVNEGTEGVVKSVSVNYSTITPDANGVYNVKLGTSIDVLFNKTDYNIASIKANDEIVTLSSYSSTYSTTVTDENGLNFVIDATSKGSSHVTIITENPSSVIVNGGYYYGDVTLTGTTTEVEFPASVVQISVKAAAGYKTSYITVDDTQYKPGDFIPVVDGMTVRCNGEEYLRDQKLTLYVQEVDNPNSFSITLHSASNYDGLTKYIYNDELTTGYSTLMYNEDDVPMEVYSSYDLVAYLNDVKLANTSSWACSYNVDNVKEGDVLKLFYTEPDTYNVTYTVDSEAAVEVRHDRTLVIDNPSTHTVLAGTEIHVVPANDADLVVKANDADLEKDAEGKYVVTVKADTNISVAPDPAAGIDTITTDGISADAPVYNLQGIQVGIASELDRLPAGIYIVDGKKVKL